MHGGGEATPYSDLEYMILVENLDSSIEEFFTKLSITSYFLIGNLGETNLKYMAIKELNGWFQDMAPNGVMIDGLSPDAGNIPTGNGLTNRKFKFITTPEDLFQAYQHISANPDKDSIRGDLTAMICYMSLVYSSDNESDFLLRRLKSDIHSMKLSKERMLANDLMLANDMKKFNFTPDQRLSDQAYTLDAKRQLYRFPSILLFDLTVINKIYEDDAWSTAEKLKTTKRISEDFYQSLIFQLAVACFVRLSAYLFHDSQDDRVSVALQQMRNTTKSNASVRSPGDRWYVYIGLVIALADSMIPLKTQLQLKGGELGTVCKSFTSSAYSSENMTTRRIKTLYHSGHAALALRILEENTDFCKTSRECSISDLINGHNELSKPENIQTIAKILIDNSRFSDALKILAHLHECSGDHTYKTFTFHIATCQHRMGVIQKALETMQGIESSIQQFEACEIAQYYLSLGRICTDLRRFGLAEKYSVSALQIFYEEACKETVYDYYGNPTTHTSNTNRTATNLSLLSAEDRLDVLQHPTPGILNCIESLANLHREKYEGQIANQYYHHYKRIFEFLYGDESLVPAAAHGYFVLGLSSENNGQIKEAKEFYCQSLVIYQKLFGESYQHPAVALLYRKMGSACWMLKDFSAAHECLLKSLDMYYRLYGRDSVSADLADVFNDLGLLYSKMERHSDAEDNYLRALAMYSNVNQGHDNLNTANSLKQLGDNYISMEEYTTAEAHCRLSLDMYKRIHGEDSDHTDIAAVLHNLGSN